MEIDPLCLLFAAHPPPSFLQSLVYLFDQVLFHGTRNLRLKRQEKVSLGECAENNDGGAEKCKKKMEFESFRLIGILCQSERASNRKIQLITLTPLSVVGLC